MTQFWTGESWHEVSDLLTVDEMEILRRHIKNGTYKTSDPHHCGLNADGVMIYQWGFIEWREYDPGHLTIIYKTDNQVDFLAKKAVFEAYILALGRAP